MKEKSLIRQYIWKVWVFVMCNIALFWVIFISNDLSMAPFKEIWKQFTLEKSIIAAIAPLVTIVLLGVLPSYVKAILVFWRIKDPLPGSRVFTELAKEDQRIDLDRIRQKHGELPESSAEQNRLWYKIYKSHRLKIIVSESHKAFLLTRDIASVSAIFLLCFSLSSFFVSGSLKIKIGYIIFLIAQYLLLSIVARNYGNRFVCNVLAEESA